MGGKQSERAKPMKAPLNDDYIRKLKLTTPPTGYHEETGKLVFGSDPGCKSFIVWDSSQDAPPGFGVRVAGKKTYVIRRKVNGKSIMPTVGNFADFKDIKEAREKARTMAQRMLATGQNPNELDRKASSAEITLGQALADYRAYISTRAQKPAKPETLRVFDRAVQKMRGFGWIDKKVRDIPADEIESKFLANNGFKTANEQAFRWTMAAVGWRIKKEKLVASAERREPTLEASPFDILTLHNRFRSKDSLEKERSLSAARNPLSPSRTLGPFLEAAWSKRSVNDNATGVDFLILMLLWGCRKSEHAQCVWDEFLEPSGEPGVGRKRTSHVCLKADGDYGPYVFFHDTKNGRSHRLPIGPMALRLLDLRQQSAARESLERNMLAKSRRFVFPARNRNSKTGHYSDANTLLGSIVAEMGRIKPGLGVVKLNPHDLRRSFGAVMTNLELSESVKKTLLNHYGGDVTATYTKAEWEKLKGEMARIEQAIFKTAPNVYNALKPVDWPPLVAVEPHVPLPPKPRSGRPRKVAATEASGPNTNGSSEGGL